MRAPIVLTWLVVLPFLLGASPAAAISSCLVCRYSECEPSPFDDFGAATCETRCKQECDPASNGTVCVIECACRTSGECGDPFGGGPPEDAGSIPLGDPWLIAIQKVFPDRIVRAIAAQGVIAGPFQGQVTRRAIDDPGTGFVETYEYEGEGAIRDDGSMAISVVVFHYRRVARFELEIGADQRSGWLQVEAPNGQRQAFAIAL